MSNLFDLGVDSMGQSLGNAVQSLQDTEFHFDLDPHMSDLERLSGEYASSLLEEINLLPDLEAPVLHTVDSSLHGLANYARDEAPNIFKCLAADSETTFCLEDKPDMSILDLDIISVDSALTGLNESVWDDSHHVDGMELVNSLVTNGYQSDWDDHFNGVYDSMSLGDDDISWDTEHSSDLPEINIDEQHSLMVDTDTLEDGVLGDLSHEFDNAISADDSFHHYEQAASGPDYQGVWGEPGLDATYWHHQNTDYTCAVVSQETILNELTGHHYTEGELLQEATANGWCTNTGMPIQNMHKLLEAHGVETVQSTGRTLDDIEALLAHGHKVVVAINADDIWHYEQAVGDLFLRDYGHVPLNSPNHAVVVTGIDYTNPAIPMVILNDSGTPDGAAEMVPAGVFMVAWKHSNNYMVNTTGRFYESHPPTAQTAMLGDNFENAAYNASWADYYRQKAEYDASYGY